MIWDELGCEIHIDALRDPTAGQFVGIECEIEAITDHGRAEQLGWRVTTDGSLRNNGHEYISNPVSIPVASTMFKKLHGTISTGTFDPFSQRTSIHVHANCANMKLKEVRDTVWLYALFEEAFFLMCAPDRRDNIHCTPLTETYLPSIYSGSISNMISRWHKYTALNLKPLTKQGTIEFRHMHGHADDVLMDEWLLIIRNLLATAKEAPLDSTLLQEDNIKMLFGKIFGCSRLSNDYTLVRSLMTNQILDLKLAVI
jgi:hypothetical protein